MRHDPAFTPFSPASQILHRCRPISEAIGDEPAVLMHVPRLVVLTREPAADAHLAPWFIPPGRVRVPARLAGHWWLKANGAKVIDAAA